MNKKLDQKYIHYALNLAKKNVGLTSPNPVVGCVIVKNNSIISTGITAKGGRPHAEDIAINKLLTHNNGQDLLQGSTLYVTLEPCSHVGQTQPCVNKIINHKISRVVIATQDPDSRVNGQGIAQLKENGIDVDCGIMEDDAKALNKAFFHVKHTGLPFITLKLATSLDGKIATKNLHSKWITGPKARHFSHHLRATHDAIMIGGNTLRQDNPMLDCRIPGLESYSPTRIIISKQCEFDDQLKVFKNANRIPTMLVTSNKNAAIKHCTTLIEPLDQHHINLETALKNIAQTGINSILVEGGSNLATQLLHNNLVNEMIWIRNKKIIGNDGLAAIGNMNFLTINDVINSFYKERIVELGDDIIEFFVSI